jgi:hypothetical protein
MRWSEEKKGTKRNPALIDWAPSDHTFEFSSSSHTSGIMIHSHGLMSQHRLIRHSRITKRRRAASAMVCATAGMTSNGISNLVTRPVRCQFSHSVEPLGS